MALRDGSPHDSLDHRVRRPPRPHAYHSDEDWGFSKTGTRRRYTANIDTGVPRAYAPRYVSDPKHRRRRSSSEARVPDGVPSRLRAPMPPGPRSVGAGSSNPFAPRFDRDASSGEEEFAVPRIRVRKPTIPLAGPAQPRIHDRRWGVEPRSRIAARSHGVSRPERQSTVTARSAHASHPAVPGGPNRVIIRPPYPRDPSPDSSSSSPETADESPRRIGPGSPRAPRADQAVSISSSSTKTFGYRDLGPREFRLVRIHPEKMTTLWCDVLHASLDNPPDYIAISYSWGDPGDTQMIHIGGAEVAITTSLHGALGALRQRSDYVTVWADALCINQQDQEERTNQVEQMTRIYNQAESVAIWLGPEADDSALATRLLQAVADQSHAKALMQDIISSESRRREFAALVSLFERDYWGRLWVVQEIFNAADIHVHCGSSKLPWSVYKKASIAFKQYRDDVNFYYPGGMTDGKQCWISRTRLPYAEVLVWHGPGSFPDLKALLAFGDSSLLEVLRACRRKLAADARDKVFGVLGVLPQEIRSYFSPNYTLSVREVYTNVVDYLLTTTRRFDVVCEAIYFPLHTNSVNLPSWVPDWSQVTQTASLGLSYNNFDAAPETDVKFSFKGHRKSKLQISAIPLDTVRTRGVAVGTLCARDDFMMAFLQWRALLLAETKARDKDEDARLREAFCRTICIGQMPRDNKDPHKWAKVCYHIFATLLRERLPHIPLDNELVTYAEMKVEIEPRMRKKIVREICGARMMGRCFCITDKKLLGMGTGFMAPGDAVVVPLGAYTPVLLRPDGRGEYRFVGDIYVDDYMSGRALEQYKDGKRKLVEYVIH